MKPSGEREVDAWLRRLSSVPGLASRRALWAETLRSRSPESAAHLVDDVVAAAVRQREGAVTAYLPLADLRTLSETLGPGILGTILLAARDGQREKCLLLLEHPGPPRVKETLGPPPDPLVDTLSLGHRKTAARGPRSTVLERILRDPDPRIVGEALRNPRLRECEVLAIASRRPCPEEVGWLLTGAEKWIQRPAVRRALILNPHTPPRLATALAVLMNSAELEEVHKQAGLHPAVRDGALQILEWRRR